MNNKKENISILLIGLGLILLVGAITFTKFYLQKPTQKDQASSKEKNISENINIIKPADLLKKINKKETLNIIDIRTKEEYDFEHIIGSQNWDGDKILNVQENILDEKNYIIIDSSQTPYGKSLIQSLKNADNLFYLEGGFDAWKKGFYPTISIGNPESIVDRSKTEEFNIEELKKLLENQQKVILVDLRGEETFQKEHLKGAINIPLSEVEKRYLEIPSGDVFVYGENELQSFQGSVKLCDLGLIGNKFAKSNFQSLKESGIETEPKSLE